MRKRNFPLCLVEQWLLDSQTKLHWLFYTFPDPAVAWTLNATQLQKWSVYGHDKGGLGNQKVPGRYQRWSIGK